MTYHPKSDFMHVMMTRGYLADCTDYQGLDEALVKGVVPAYIGYDATAASLHVGHLLNIMMLRWLQKTGGKPITLMGGGHDEGGRSVVPGGGAAAADARRRSTRTSRA